jgi:homoserine O-acetyltransferase
MKATRETFRLSGWKLDSGESVPIELPFLVYGDLATSGENAILVCHHFSGSPEAGGVRGWWSDLIGPGRALDTDRYAVICPSLLCNVNAGAGQWGVSGPQSWGDAIPAPGIEGNVRLQKALLDHLGVSHLSLVTGPSMGGFQALEWAAAYPGSVSAVVPVATATRCSAYFAQVLTGIEQILSGGLPEQQTLTLAAYILQAGATGPLWAEDRRDVIFGDGLWRTAAARSKGWAASHLRAMIRTARQFDLSNRLAKVSAPVLMVAIDNDLYFPPELTLDAVRDLRELGKTAEAITLSSRDGHSAAISGGAVLEESLRRALTW